ncbi:hypothetical protein Calab_1455 [Caldithrix abyssi DSM 13497]|uniref:Bacteriophage HK97-gp10, putative tail-component n=1 Tax=Caldithrix abyssi DSM 13497 TaxID=880073 RepID=H1XPV0_CALAY|nr:HK97 gp10 family phage protein [Caldithrix abyssi]APF20396.1 Bacteriophage HK97-gp10, putative tail-component [Caldithrix abyssi DSM 13497]EHO41076.1 hypothetical protein Calab_1455 [Caldithrix abyssi DSM 13497]
MDEQGKKIVGRIRKQIKKNLERELANIGEDMVANVVEYLDRRNINVTGDLRKSIVSEVKREQEKLLLTVGTNLLYAPFVHYGTKPHWPPKKAIRKWVYKKFGLTHKALNRATFLIRRKIAEQGTRKKPFLLAVYRLYKPRIVKRLQAAAIKV